MSVTLDEPRSPVEPAPSAPPAPGFPAVDLRLVQLVVESAAIVRGEASGEEPVDAEVDAMLVDQIALLESIQHTLAALQATLTRTFARRHVATRLAAGEADPRELERSVIGQLGLACRVSPTRARARLAAARDLAEGLTHIQALFAAGELSPVMVEAVVAATRDLDRRERAEVDRRLAEHDLSGLGVGTLRSLARRLAAEAAPEKFRQRVASARAARRVTLRPAEDGMTWLTAYLPSSRAPPATPRSTGHTRRSRPTPLPSPAAADRSWPTPSSSGSRARSRPTPCRSKSRPWCPSRR